MVPGPLDGLHDGDGGWDPLAMTEHFGLDGLVDAPTTVEVRSTAVLA